MGDLTCNNCGEYVGSPIADRIEALESKLRHYKHEVVETALANEKDAADRIEALEARIAKADALAEALSFYAAATVEYPNGKITFQPGDDNGQRAQAALAAYRESDT